LHPILFLLFLSIKQFKIIISAVKASSKKISAYKSITYKPLFCFFDLASELRKNILLIRYHRNCLRENLLMVIQSKLMLAKEWGWCLKNNIAEDMPDL